MTIEAAKARDETEVRKLIDGLAAAIRAKDATGALSHYAPDVVRFDLQPPLRFVGAAAPARQELEEWFASFTGPVGYALRDLAVTAAGDVAYCHGLARISGARTDGEQTDVWGRLTICLRRIGGGWKIAHEHQSVPFYMDGSLRAAVDLQP